MNQVMQRLQKMKSEEYSSFVRVLFGLTSPSPVSRDVVEGKDLEWVDLNLNESQKEAIRFALNSKEVALIHGPPGVRAPFDSNT
jgi:DNA polymerase alpha-associated DNA helicase A